jgi:hypothetical protein
VIMLLSHDQRCWRSKLAVPRCKCRVVLMTVLLSHTGDGPVTPGSNGCGKVAQPPRSEHRGVIAS